MRWFFIITANKGILISNINVSENVFQTPDECMNQVTPDECMNWKLGWHRCMNLIDIDVLSNEWYA